MAQMSDVKMTLVRGLIEQAPDLAVRNLLLALRADGRHDQSLTLVQQMVELEASDRRARNLVFAPIAPLCAVAGPFSGLAFPPRALTLIWKALKELQLLGLIDAVPTRMHAVQAAGCGPIVTMIKQNSDVLVPVRPNTIAKSLAIGNPADGYYAFRAVKDSGGAAEHASDDEILDAITLLARTEGIFTETAGGVTLAATRKLIERGVIPREEPIVVCITGNGLKTAEVVGPRLAEAVRIRPSLSAFDRALSDLKSLTRS